MFYIHIFFKQSFYKYIILGVIAGNIAGCGSSPVINETLVESNYKNRPSWSVVHKNADKDVISFVGISDEKKSEKGAFDDAFAHAQNQFAGWVESEVNSSYQKKKRLSEGMNNTIKGRTSISREQQIKINSIVSKLQVKDSYTEKWEKVIDGVPVRSWYKAWVLCEVNSEDADKIFEKDKYFRALHGNGQNALLADIQNENKTFTIALLADNERLFTIINRRLSMDGFKVKKAPEFTRGKDIDDTLFKKLDSGIDILVKVGHEQPKFSGSSYGNDLLESKSDFFIEAIFNQNEIDLEKFTDRNTGIGSGFNKTSAQEMMYEKGVQKICERFERIIYRALVEKFYN